MRGGIQSAEQPGNGGDGGHRGCYARVTGDTTHLSWGKLEVTHPEGGGGVSVTGREGDEWTAGITREMCGNWDMGWWE